MKSLRNSFNTRVPDELNPELNHNSPEDSHGRLSKKCPLLPKVLLGLVYQGCMGSDCPFGLWDGYYPAPFSESEIEARMPKRGFIRGVIQVRTPMCRKYGEVSGYGRAGKEKNKTECHNPSGK